MANPIDALAQFLGVPAQPPGQTVYGDPFGAIESTALQGKRLGESQDAALNGDPRQARIAQFLQGQMDSDPYTGVAEGKRIDGIRQQLDQAAMYQRPEMVDQRAMQRSEAGDLAQRDAYGKSFGTTAGTTTAQDTPEFQRVAGEANQREIDKSEAPVLAKMGMAGGSSSGGGGDVVGTLAEQYRRNPAYPVPADLKDAVAVRAAQMGNLSGPQTNQERARAESAGVGLPVIPELRQKAIELQNAGWFNPLTGRVRKWMASNGIPIPGDSELTQKQSNFESQLGYLVKQLQNIHAGARGGASESLGKAFQALLNGNGSIDDFMGQLDASEELLKRYHGDPVLSSATPGNSDPLGIR